MWKFIKEAWGICVERYLTHRALRLLSKQSWSIEFLSALLIRSAKCMGTDLEMTISDESGRSIKVNTLTVQQPLYKDDSIFDHLDDEVRIRQFMNSVGAR